MSLKEKIKIFLANFRSLPSSTKRLLSLGMVLALVVALPLFVWAIVNQTFDIRKRAATGEPPTPTPTIWPSPRPTPTSKPTITPSPSPSPTAVPPQPPNRNPVISTKSLPVAIYGKYYSTKISGYDWNKNDKLSLGIGGLPKGVRNVGCSNFFDKDGRNSITCKISGVPQSTGRHYVSVSLTDGNGGTAYKNFILWVFKPFLLK